MMSGAKRAAISKEGESSHIMRSKKAQETKVPGQNRHQGIVDIGSNSVRLMIAEIREDMTFQIVDQWKEVVRLGDEYDEDGAIPEYKIDKLISTLLLFKQLCSRYEPCEIIAVATAALRKATNRALILSRILGATQLSVRVISGESEAYLDYLAVVSTMNIQNGLLIDIGGGSLEMVLIQQRELKESISIPIGALTLASQYEVRGALQAKEEQRLIADMEKLLSQIDWLQQAEGYTLIGVGGTIRTIAKMDKAQVKVPLASLHHYVLEREQVKQWHKSLKPLLLEEREKIQGLSKDRADIFMGAFTFIKHVMERLDMPALMVSAKGIREGVLFDMLQGNGLTIDDPLSLSISNMMRRFHLQVEHASRVHVLFTRLVEDMGALMELEGDWSQIMCASAMLHDCGIVISPLERERHALYMLLHSDLYGLTPRELVLSAFLASADQKLKAGEAWSDYEALFHPGDKEGVRTLSILLRLAISFNRGAATDVALDACDIEEQEVVFHVRASTPPLLEVSEAYAVRTAFRKRFKRDLVIVAHVTQSR